MTRPASFVRRVEQAMFDLLAVRRDHRRDLVPVEGDPLPIGVAARLALLVVAASDPGLLTGALRRGTSEEQKARGKDLGRAAGSAESVDLRARVAVPVRCGKRIHPVALSADGAVVAFSHPGIDVDVERVAGALGGAMLPCVREMI